MEKEEEDEVLKMKELTYFGAPSLKTHFDRVITTILFIIIIILSSLSFHFSLITELSFFFTIHVVASSSVSFSCGHS